MNLLEFLENWDDNTQVLVEKNTEKIFSGKIAEYYICSCCCILY